jgi:hypothetical protein
MPNLGNSPFRPRRSALLTVLAVLVAAVLGGGLLAPSQARASQGGCTTAWTEGFNIGTCISDQNTGTTGSPDAYINYVPSASSCDIHIQVWDDNNHQYSDKQVGCTPGHYLGNQAGPVGSAVNLHAYARLDLNGTHFAVGDSVSIKLGQGVSGQGQCSINYLIQGFSIGVCVNDRHTGTTAYPDIYVNSTPFSSNCNLDLQVWGDNNNLISDAGPAPCSTGHIFGVQTPAFRVPIKVHSYVRINLNGGAYAGPNSQKIQLGGWYPATDWIAKVQQTDLQGDPINVMLSGAGNVSMDTLLTALNNVSPADGNPSWQAVGILPLGCANGLLADVDPAQLPLVPADYVVQQYTVREGGCTSILMTGVDHFRAWQQGASGAWFIAASTEEPCGPTTPNHCVISYQAGRSELVTDILAAARNNNWQVATDDVAGAYPIGHTDQPNGNNPTYDGHVEVITLTQ